LNVLSLCLLEKLFPIVSLLDQFQQRQDLCLAGLLKCPVPVFNCQFPAEELCNRKVLEPAIKGLGTGYARIL